ncbi:flotillin-like FloA family protein [Candidatus Uabimicrobium amorphum]|uniref:Uncharacterized protein n=1 Tax=Uabimicrobium amorphum TaxID=2596890 RepID=A0A5S9IKI4_UABAM|nr:flotillin-like FloA family protein [Candidatus Uabimicrobium amorphum]BBM82275.1 hypothetical protein UABAM_00618 [Candidatus Uabimicrobium amorphum]
MMEFLFIASFTGAFVAAVWIVILVVFAWLMFTFRKGMLNRIDSEILAHKAMAEAQGIDITVTDLEIHRHAGGDIANVVTSMIAAKMEGETLTFQQACAKDLTK